MDFGLLLALYRILVNPENPADMAFAVSTLLADNKLRQRLSKNANKVAVKEFSLDIQVDEYLQWYDKITEHWQKEQGTIN